MNRLRCLVVDDREDNLYTICELFRLRFPDVEVLSARGAKKAQVLLRENRVDFAIIDVQMPGIDGIQLCRQIKQNPQSRDLHIVMITSHTSSPELRALVLEAGADDFLTRPMEAMEFAARIRATLRIVETERALQVANRKLASALAANEEALFLSEEQLRLYAALTQDAIFTFDDRNQLVYVNRAAAGLLGYERSQLIGSDIFQIIPEAVHSKNTAVFRDFIVHGGEPFATLDLELRTLAGPCIPVEASVTAWDQGERAYVTMLARDIRERLHSEKEKSEIQIQLIEAQKMETVALVAGGMAHDLNNVLSGFDLNLVLLRRSLGDLPEAAARFFQVLRNEVRRARSVTSRVLTFTRRRPETGDRIEIKVDEYLQELGLFFQGMLPASISLSIAPVDPSLTLVCDAGVLEQLLLNLLINARDAIENVGVICLRVIEESAWVILEVADDGSGIEPQILDHIFEPFFTTKGTRGTGLGLSVVKNMTEMIGGRIEVASCTSAGSTFRLRIPIQPLSGEVQSPTHAKLKEDCTILVIEDDTRLGQALVGALRMENHEVSLAQTNQQARVLLGDQEFDLVIADLSLPDGQVLPLLREIRSREQPPALLLMSGYSEHSLTAAGENSLPFLAKPFTMDSLNTAVHGVLLNRTVTD